MSNVGPQVVRVSERSTERCGCGVAACAAARRLRLAVNVASTSAAVPARSSGGNSLALRCCAEPGCQAGAGIGLAAHAASGSVRRSRALFQQWRSLSARRVVPSVRLWPNQSIKRTSKSYAFGRRLSPTLGFMLPRTHAFLQAKPEVWDDGYVAFGVGPNPVPSRELDAALAFFGSSRLVSALSGHGSSKVKVTREALREIDLATARTAIVQVLKNDLRMFSVRKVDPAVLEELAAIFFEEMGSARAYTNTVVYSAEHMGSVLGPFSPVTAHTVDTLVCVVNEQYVAYWLYGDDE